MQVFNNRDFFEALSAVSRRKIVHLRTTHNRRIRLGSVAGLLPSLPVRDTLDNYLDHPAVLRVVLADDNKRDSIYLKDGDGFVPVTTKPNDRHYFIVTDWDSDSCTFIGAPLMQDGFGHHIEAK